MTIRTRTLPFALLLVCAACQGPGPANPIADDVRADPWESTAWTTWFQQVKDMGGRANLDVVADQRFSIRPSAAPELWVFTEPTCSVSDRPAAAEARRFLNCLDDRVLGDPIRVRYDEFGEPVLQRWEWHTYIITWEPDDGMWHVWTVPGWGCGTADWEAREAGRIRPK